MCCWWVRNDAHDRKLGDYRPVMIGNEPDPASFRLDRIRVTRSHTPGKLTAQLTGVGFGSAATAPQADDGVGHELFGQVSALLRLLDDEDDVAALLRGAHDVGDVRAPRRPLPEGIGLAGQHLEARDRADILHREERILVVFG